ncbi:hypothetical protein B0H15DRAFT_958578 [Mycena belliarum]|uniref:Uncharacterized protein n=1 Tax=Mycena belliarum TaxID=1033014 RepID=A0AAD6TKA8_9AGAR|nr:hypothetical protein B0H15DRAFT_958578 [Mycena belliae]
MATTHWVRSYVSSTATDGLRPSYRKDGGTHLVTLNGAAPLSKMPPPATERRSVRLYNGQFMDHEWAVYPDWESDRLAARAYVPAQHGVWAQQTHRDWAFQWNAQLEVPNYAPYRLLPAQREDLRATLTEALDWSSQIGRVYPAYFIFRPRGAVHNMAAHFPTRDDLNAFVWDVRREVLAAYGYISAVLARDSGWRSRAWYGTFVTDVDRLGLLTGPKRGILLRPAELSEARVRTLLDHGVPVHYHWPDGTPPSDIDVGYAPAALGAVDFDAERKAQADAALRERKRERNARRAEATATGVRKGKKRWYTQAHAGARLVSTTAGIAKNLLKEHPGDDSRSTPEGDVTVVQLWLERDDDSGDSDGEGLPLFPWEEPELRHADDGADELLEQQLVTGAPEKRASPVPGPEDRRDDTPLGDVTAAAASGGAPVAVTAAREERRGRSPAAAPLPGSSRRRRSDSGDRQGDEGWSPKVRRSDEGWTTWRRHSADARRSRSRGSSHVWPVRPRTPTPPIAQDEAAEATDTATEYEKSEATTTSALRELLSNTSAVELVSQLDEQSARDVLAALMAKAGGEVTPSEAGASGATTAPRDVPASPAKGTRPVPVVKPPRPQPDRSLLSRVSVELGERLASAVDETCLSTRMGEAGYERAAAAQREVAAAWIRRVMDWNGVPVTATPPVYRGSTNGAPPAEGPAVGMRLSWDSRTAMRVLLWTAEDGRLSMTDVLNRCYTLGCPLHMWTPFFTQEPGRRPPLYRIIPALPHEPDADLTREAIEQYERNVVEVFNRPHSRAAMHRGGLLWRIAMEWAPRTLVEELWQPVDPAVGPIQSDPAYGWTYTLTRNEEDALLGVTRRSGQIWPPLEFWERYARWHGQWTEGNESWFVQRVRDMRGQGRTFQARNKQKWRSGLHLLSEVMMADPTTAGRAAEADDVLGTVESEFPLAFEGVDLTRV